MDDVANWGLHAALGKEVNLTAPFTPSYFNEELRGLSDASGVSYSLLQEIHMAGQIDAVFLTRFFDAVFILITKILKPRNFFLSEK